MKNMVGKFFAKLLGGGKSVSAKLGAFNKASKGAKDAMRGEVRQNIQKGRALPNGFSKYKEFVHNSLLAQEMGKRLSTKQKKAIDLYTNYFVNEVKKECIDIEGSRWLIHACYYPKTKTVFIKMKNGKILYPFFRVPKTKWALLATGRGHYMWDWFGKHYSANSRNWIRKGR